jgi:hypothetical protein
MDADSKHKDKNAKDRDTDPKDSNAAARDWLTWVVLATVLALLITTAGYLMYRRLTRRVRVISERSCPVAPVTFFVTDESGKVIEGITNSIK